MIISARVRARIAALNITQSELARRVGVTQGAIAKLANNDPNGSSYLHKLARELGTTAEYLTGETEDPQEGSPPVPQLSADQRELLELYNAMDDASRRSLMHVARSMGGEPLRASESAFA